MIDEREVFSLGGLDLVNEVLDIYNQKENVKVLDVGCGSGYSVNYLSQKGFNATGIDASKETIEIGRKKYKNINIQVMDANYMDFPKDYFDLIIFECSLSIMKEPIKILSDCRNFLKKDGLILLSDFFFKEKNIENDIYTLSYWNRIFSDLNFQVISFKDKTKEWKRYLGMILWEYGELTSLLRGNQNSKINNNILKKETGYFLVTLRKVD
ncbi:class I SAM-dependent methyltransferase [Terrisporobacter sp.]